MNTRSGFQLKGTGPEIYESCFVPAQMGRFATHLVDAAAVSAGDTVLDVACGTGVVARAAARKAGTSGSITGVDLNDARKSLKHRRLSAPVMSNEANSVALCD